MNDTNGGYKNKAISTVFTLNNQLVTNTQLSLEQMHLSAYWFDVATA